jgi:hypothetical protein
MLLPCRVCHGLLMPSGEPPSPWAWHSGFPRRPLPPQPWPHSTAAVSPEHRHGGQPFATPCLHPVAWPTSLCPSSAVCGQTPTGQARLSDRGLVLAPTR